MAKTKESKEPKLIIFLKMGQDQHGVKKVRGIEHIMSDREIDVVVLQGDLDNWYYKSPWEKHGRLRGHKNYRNWSVISPKRTVNEAKVRDFVENFRSDMLRGRIEGTWSLEK